MNNIIYDSTKNVFKQMLQLEMEKKGEEAVVNKLTPTKEINVVIGFTGDSIEGNVLYSLSEKIALNIVKKMLGMKQDKVDEITLSAVGEIANIISGSAANTLSEKNYICNITPPQVIVGKEQSIFTPITKLTIIPIETSIGDLDIYIALEDK
ncbi:MAG: chemotaxis protein CheX [archaeon]